MSDNYFATNHPDSVVSPLNGHGTSLAEPPHGTIAPTPSDLYYQGNQFAKSLVEPARRLRIKRVGGAQVK